MQAYLKTLQRILDEGEQQHDRTGQGTLSIFGEQLRFDLREGFPLLTTKRVHLRSIIAELLWIIDGDTNETTLRQQGVGIWRQWRRPYHRPRRMVEVAPREAIPAPAPASIPATPALDSPQDQSLAHLWEELMRRAYDPAHPGHDPSVTVHPAWHDPQAFIEGVKALPHWWYKQHDPQRFTLTAGYYGAWQYGPETAVWIAQGEQLGWQVGEEGQLLGWQVGEEGQLHRQQLIEDGDLGPVYGAQWRDHVGVRRAEIRPDGLAPVIHTDQLKEALRLLREDPGSRRIIIDAWSVTELSDMALTPCHCLVQFRASQGWLDCQLYQRSADYFLGAPFNIASYALLTMLVAHHSGLRPRHFVWTGGDVHLYLNQLEQAREQLRREPRALPQMRIDHQAELSDYRLEHFHLEGYQPHGTLRAEVAV